MTIPRCPATSSPTAAPTASTAGTSSSARARTTTDPSALEQVLPLLGVDEGPQLTGEAGVADEAGVGVDDLERHLACQPHRLLVAPERGELQVGHALLPRPEDRPLAPQVKVDLRQLEAVRAGHEGRQAA